MRLWQLNVLALAALLALPVAFQYFFDHRPATASRNECKHPQDEQSAKTCHELGLI
jgi:hypothetical protein